MLFRIYCESIMKNIVNIEFLFHKKILFYLLANNWA